MSSEMNNLSWLLLEQHHLSERAHQIAIIDDHHSITYRELHEHVIGFITQHPSIFALPVGSRVLCLYNDSISAVVIFLALLRGGLVPCMVNPNLPMGAYDKYLQLTAPSYILADSSHLNKLECLLISKHIPFCNVSENTTTASDDDYPIKPVEPLSDAFGLFTSGTTGQPNLVVHRHQDPWFMNRNYGQHVLNINDSDILFSTSKLFFAYGLNNILFALIHGITGILSPQTNALDIIWKKINQYKPSIIFSVPTVYLRLLDHPDLPTGLEHVRLCISAGEHLPTSLYQRWKQRFNLPIIDGIGTTEILSTFISNTPEHSQEGSTGKIVPGFIAEIRNEYDHILPANEIGVLWIKGDTYPTAYLNQPEMTRKRFMDGWFKTYDLFSCDENGFYHYHGRANDLIKCGGIWIFPHRIETILNSHPLVIESAVVGVQQEGLLRPAAYIVLKQPVEDSNALISQLKHQCQQKCSKHEYPHLVYFVNNIPKTPTGKLQRYQLQGRE